MNHFAAREIRDADGNQTGRFHYTEATRGGTYAVGYCSPLTLCPGCGGKFVSDEPSSCRICNGRGLLPKPDPCPGHSTEAEACEHYRQYILDKVKVKGPMPVDSWPKHKCRVADCPFEGNYLIDSGGMAWCFEVCQSHANRQGMELLVPSIGETWSS